MKKSRDREENHPHKSLNAEGRNFPDEILVFLVLATFLLAAASFSSIYLYFSQRKKTELPQSMPNKYVWVSGSPALDEGLYLFTPEMLKKKFPGICKTDVEVSDATDTRPSVFAIQYTGDSFQAVNLPPQVASIFFQPIPLNRAETNILSTLPGIGPVIAERIVQRRKEKGPFQSLDELLQVTGIGPGKLTSLNKHLYIDN